MSLQIKTQTDFFIWLLRVCVLAWSFFILPGTPSFGQVDGDEVLREAEKLFNWFDSLGYKDFSKLQLVRVEKGRPPDFANEESNHLISYAFLTHDSEKTFSVYTLRLTERSFDVSTSETPPDQIVKLEKINLEDHVYELLQQHELRIESSEPEIWQPRGKCLNEGSEFIILARACQAQNHPELVWQLLDAAKQLYPRSRVPNATKNSLQQNLCEDLAQLTMWKIIDDFGDLEISREQLLKRLEKLVELFPESSQTKRARESAILLRSMIAEDEVHPPIEDFDQLSTEDKVAQLIFQLRDQHGYQFGQPGECDIFFDDNFSDTFLDFPTGPTPTPAKRLLDLGFDAVPQLIEALDDTRFTRSVGFHRGFYFSHHVLRVGDAAEQILSKIAHQRFYDRANSNSAMVKDGKVNDVKEKIKEWWDEYKIKGEKCLLIEETLRADKHSPNVARLLVKKYPDDAIEVIRQAAINADSSAERFFFIGIAATLGDKAIDFLIEEMNSSPLLSNRVRAASKLDSIEPGAATSTMIKQWKSVSHLTTVSDVDESISREGVNILAKFLASSNSVDAVKALHEHYHQHTVDVRRSIICGLLEVRNSPGSKDTQNNPSESGDKMELNPALEFEVESLLITGLSDTDYQPSVMGSWGRFVYNDPQVCDFAAYVLLHRYPDRYPFKLLSGDGVDEQRRLHAIDHWRKQQRLPRIKTSKPEPIVRIPQNKIEPILRALLSSTNDAQTKEAIDALQSLGIAALPAIIETIEGLPFYDEKVEPLRDVARELSNSITVINVSEHSAPVPEKLKQRLNQLRGKTLSGDNVSELLSSIARDLPDGATGVKLIIQRSGTSSGVEISVCLTKYWPLEKKPVKKWNFASRVATLHYCGSLTTNSKLQFEKAKDPGSFSLFKRNVDQFLLLHAGIPLEIYCRLIREK